MLLEHNDSALSQVRPVELGSHVEGADFGEHVDQAVVHIEEGHRVLLVLQTLLGGYQEFFVVCKVASFEVLLILGDGCQEVGAGEADAGCFLAVFKSQVQAVLLLVVFVV